VAKASTVIWRSTKGITPDED
jgi:hypothetical protein